MRLTTYLFIALLAFSMTSCGDDDTVQETFNYSITIMSPNGTTEAVAGEDIHIHVNFDEADMKTIHNVTVHVMDNENNMIYNFTEHVHETSGHYEHHADLILDVEPGTELTLHASVSGHEADHEENEHEHENGKVNDSFSFIAR